MNQFTNSLPLDIRAIETVVHDIFPVAPVNIERVPEGISTYVYRLTFGKDTFYLRVLPEKGECMAAEAAVHQQLYQSQVKIPEVIHFESCNDLLQRSIMVTRAIAGQPISQSASTLSQRQLATILEAAGQDLAHVNTLSVNGFGWAEYDASSTRRLWAQWPTYRTFINEHWEADISFLRSSFLTVEEIAMLEALISSHANWLDSEHAVLAHGDLDTTHIYQENGQYSGIIDFGEIRGADPWYDLGHFHMREGEQLALSLEAYLIDGYTAITALPSDYPQRIRFSSLLINVRSLSRSLQKRPPNCSTQHMLAVLRRDLATLV